MYLPFKVSSSTWKVPLHLLHYHRIVLETVMHPDAIGAVQHQKKQGDGLNGTYPIDRSTDGFLAFHVEWDIHKIEIGGRGSRPVAITERLVEEKNTFSVADVIQPALW